MRASIIVASLLCISSIIIGSNSHALTDSDLKEIERAAQGAPNRITDNASFMVFRDGFFKLVKKGSNNFTCMVIKNPDGRFEPSCFNKPAMDSVFYSYQMEMKLLYEGVGPEVVQKALLVAFNQGKLPTAKPASLVYMMSPNNKYYDHHHKKLGDSPIHQMYYYPRINNETFNLGPGNPWLCQCFPHLSALIVEVDAQE